MHNMKRRIRLTIIGFILIAVLTAVTFFSLSSTAKAGQDGNCFPMCDGKLIEKYTATMILWYTQDGMPHNIFIVDSAHVSTIGNEVIIDRDRTDHVPDQVLRGGMFDLQTFGYSQVFEFLGSGSASGKYMLRPKYQEFAVQFKNKAAERLTLKSTDE